MTDPDALLSQYEGRLADAQRKSDAIREGLTRLRVVESSADGQIVVTINDAGNLVDLKLGTSLQRKDGDSVAQEVLRVLQGAQSRVAATVQEALSPMLGADSEAMHFMMDKLRSAHPLPPAQYVPGGGYGDEPHRLGAIEDDAPPSPPVARPRPQLPRSSQDDEEDFGDKGFLR
ncbi:YbaB/EbfC family nucleoid-associated protein [Lentzea sp. CA-135723]|uniref:YbaB/EbfC family nucleoid-associated protein n=1 Tax=Lentzea sp. CA-135723 TaxID=3239950 RepID=UPI003D8DE85E